MVAGAFGPQAYWRAPGARLVKALIFGSTGQVGTALLQHFEAEVPTRAEADFLNPEHCADIVRQTPADVVINAAAYTAVDAAEDDYEAAVTVNATTPGALAKACADKDLPFFHISTDYVFDGGGESGWREEDPVCPINAYGRSKSLGEDAVLAAGGQEFVLRTSWVFSKTGDNFVRTMLRLAQARNSLDVVSEQIGGPTFAGDIGAALKVMAETVVDTPSLAGGIYHFAGAPEVSRADWVREIIKRTGVETAVRDVPLSAFPTPAQRPLNSRLNCDKIAANFGIERPGWQRVINRDWLNDT